MAEAGIELSALPSWLGGSNESHVIGDMLESELKQ
jgi:hypothetical protein